MAANRDIPHVLLPRAATTPYQLPQRDFGKMAPTYTPPGDRRGHASKLLHNLQSAEAGHDACLREVGEAGRDEDFLYLRVQVGDVAHFEAKWLEPHARSSGIRVAALGRPSEDGSGEFSVFVPRAEVGRFRKKLSDYLNTADQQRPSVAEQVDRWRDVGLAGVRTFFTDAAAAFPAEGEEIWWEVHLAVDGSDETRPIEEDFRQWCRTAGIEVAPRSLHIDRRLVCWCRCAPGRWQSALLFLTRLAELRRARELASPYLDLGADDARGFVADLADRVIPLGANPPAICVADSGGNRAHPLLEPFLAAADQHTHRPEWGVDDVTHEAFAGHGTNMCGVGLYGEGLAEALAGSGPIEIRHLLETVKILPRAGGNTPFQVPLILAAVPAGPEIARPKRRRVFVLAVSSPKEDASGMPSLDAAVIDALAVGRVVDADPSTDRLVEVGAADPKAARLWVVSAGNVRGAWREDFEGLCAESVIESPGEAWNALTVGATTSLDRVEDPPAAALAPAGGLSPFSRTSHLYDADRPVKPEIVMEGGNLTGVQAPDALETHDDLSLLTTHHRPIAGLFETMRGTSPAAAAAARLVALLIVERPELRPETLRGLMVHAARWTPWMQERLRSCGDKRAQRLGLLRRFGWGVPDLDRLLRSVRNELTLICEDELVPFDAQGRYAGMKFHRLPWPTQTLMDLGETRVRMRVTLSTFVDPHVARRGRYGYPSHQFRFDVARPGEDKDTFRKKVNAAVPRQDHEELGDRADSKWFFGTNARTRGSVFSDTWAGAARDLAECGEIAVVPVTGWWKDRKIARSARYSLLASIETADENVDFSTEVMQKLPVEVEASATG